MTEVLTVDGARRVRVVDSHTGGEPTRVVTDGFPDLEGATLAERAADMAGRHRRLATAIVDEPRGNEAMVGALLTPPTDPACVAGVIYFDRTMVLGMCGHGTIGVVETLARLGRIGPGEHAIETPVGVVRTVLGDDGRVTIDNVVSRRTAHDVRVDVPGIGVRGRIRDGRRPAGDAARAGPGRKARRGRAQQARQRGGLRRPRSPPAWARSVQRDRLDQDLDSDRGLGDRRFARGVSVNAAHPEREADLAISRGSGCAIDVQGVA